MTHQLQIMPAYGKWWFLCNGKRPVEDLAPVETILIDHVRQDQSPMSCLAKDMPDWLPGRLWRMQDDIKQQ